jgi:hypothetical protein
VINICWLILNEAIIKLRASHLQQQKNLERVGLYIHPVPVYEMFFNHYHLLIQEVEMVNAFLINEDSFTAVFSQINMCQQMAQPTLFH